MLDRALEYSWSKLMEPILESMVNHLEQAYTFRRAYNFFSALFLLYRPPISPRSILGAFGPQDASKTGSRAPKTRPRALQEASKTGPKAPKRPPRPPQEASKTAPGGLEVAKRLQEASGELFGIHFTCILGPILMPKQSPHKPADNCSCGSYKTPSNTRTLPRTGLKQ